MMGEALGVWRQATKAARNGHGNSARKAGMRAVEALWPIAPKAMEQVAQSISPGWSPTSIRVGQEQRKTKPIVFQVNGIKRGLIENEGFETAQEAWEKVQRDHANLVASFLPGGYDNIIWVKDRVINVIPAKHPEPSRKPFA